MKIFLNGSKNIIKKNSILLAIILFSFQLNSQTIITGIASSYANSELDLCKFSDRITYTPEIISTCVVDSIGNFKFEFDITETEKVYIDLPTIKTYIYVEPNKEYEIRIPRKFDMTDEQFLDPFFSKKYVPAKIVKAPLNDINLLIMNYNSFLHNFKLELQNIKIDKEKFIYLDSVKSISDTFLNSFNNQYFDYYKTTEFALMKFYHIQNQKNDFVDSIFSEMPVLFNSSSYMSLFNMVFDQAFITQNSIIPISDIYTGLKNHNFLLIKDSLIKEFPLMRQNFAELLVVKGLCDKFYETPAIQDDIILTLQNAEKNLIDSNVNISIQNFLTDAISLRQGNPVPKLILPNKKDKMIDITDFQGEFVYLQFFHYKCYACMQQLALLKSYHNQKIKKLNIVTVFVGNDIQEMKNFLNNHKELKWTFVFANKNDELIKNYKVDIFPSYILIDPESKLSLQKTPTPNENFETVYNQEYQKWF